VLILLGYFLAVNALESPCKYCKYCDYCNECDNCPCDTAENSNCNMCKYCMYCKACDLCSSCEEGGILRSISDFAVSFAGKLGFEMSSLDESSIDKDIKKAKMKPPKAQSPVRNKEQKKTEL